MIFQGLYTALLTPFKTDESLDLEVFESLIESQIQAGVDGLVVLGTTGESPTISEEESEILIATAIKKADGRTQIIIGTGSNCTAKSIKASQKAQELGADGVMLVNPYYNKPTQKGLYEHFSVIAKSITIPVILYNVACRTSINLETETLLALSKIDNIVGVKEASGDLDQIKEVIASVPDDFSVLSGDDSMTLELCKSGGHGVVSVASNIVPEAVKTYLEDLQPNSFLEKLFEDIFIETNPQPIKTLLAEEGGCEEVFRLPMTTMLPENKAKLLETFENFKSA